jgi:hypothetical protein
MEIEGDPGKAALVLVQGLLGQLAQAETIDPHLFLSALHRMEDRPGQSEQQAADIRLARIAAEAVIGEESD